MQPSSAKTFHLICSRVSTESATTNRSREAQGDAKSHAHVCKIHALVATKIAEELQGGEMTPGPVDAELTIKDSETRSNCIQAVSTYVLDFTSQPRQRRGDRPGADKPRANIATHGHELKRNPLTCNQITKSSRHNIPDGAGALLKTIWKWCKHERAVRRLRPDVYITCTATRDNCLGNSHTQ